MPTLAHVQACIAQHLSAQRAVCQQSSLQLTLMQQLPHSRPFSVVHLGARSLRDSYQQGLIALQPPLHSPGTAPSTRITHPRTCHTRCITGCWSRRPSRQLQGRTPLARGSFLCPSPASEGGRTPRPQLCKAGRIWMPRTACASHPLQPASRPGLVVLLRIGSGTDLSQV